MATEAVESPSYSQAEIQVCWVCLEEASAKTQLCQPCPCPRPVHAQCLARWQLHSAGTKEENYCRFCDTKLPDWRVVLQPVIDPQLPVYPTMSVTFNGQVHHVQVRNGPGAYNAFLEEIRRIFGITEDHDMHLAFDCADPVTGALVKLNGAGSFHAAVHCATVSAAKRMRTAMGKRRRDGRRQLDSSSLQVADSATSLDLDIAALPLRSAAAGDSPAAQAAAGQGQHAGRACGISATAVPPELSAADAHRQQRRMLQQMVRRVHSLRSATLQAETRPASPATTPDRLAVLESQLRMMLETLPSLPSE